MKITIITSGQPSTNPRLVKEADALVAAGYTVTVVYQYWSAWAAQLDEELLAGKGWKAICVGGSPTKNRNIYLMSRLMHKAAQQLLPFTFKFGIAEKAIARSAFFLKLEAAKHPADLYIAHNLGALAAAVSAAKRNGAKVGFDAEDFHRSESTDDQHNTDYRLKAYLERKYFTSLDYLSTASPLISKAYQSIFPKIDIHTLLNVFPNENIDHSTIAEKRDQLRLFWFSQTIGKDRGLEQIITALHEMTGVELHLLGELRPADELYFNAFAAGIGLDTNKIKFHPPISSSSIISFAAQFDVGLATEIGIPYNRDICLTNKIFTYLQAGLAILASNTQAQSELMTLHPNIGFVYDKTYQQQLVELMLKLKKDHILLAHQKKHALKLAQTTFNWNLESEKFLSIVKKTLA